MKTRQKIEAILQEKPEATYREIMAETGLKSTSAVHFHVDRIKHLVGRPRLRQLVAENKELRATLAVFAAIKPSSFFPADGSANEGYTVYPSNWKDPVSFTGRDLARARELTK